MAKYTAKITHQVSAYGRIAGQVFENGVLIATFARGAVRNGYFPPMETKFRTDASHARFEDFSDSLTVEETIDALTAHA